MESLPTEILERIFSFLPQDYLDSCIQVCDHWADVIENMPKKTMWNPWFGKQVTADAMLTFRNTSGSRFEKADDIAEMRNRISMFPPSERTKNPFKNQTLIINMKNGNDYSALHHVLPSFIEEFGHYVHHLLYYIRDPIPQSKENLNVVFKNMSNLRSVKFYSSEWNDVNDWAKKRIDASSFSTMQHFLELEFLGGVSVKFLETLAEVYGQQIQSLTLGPYPCGGLVEALEKFHNLKHFKAFELCNVEFHTGRFKHLPIRHVSINRVKPFNDNPLVKIDFIGVLQVVTSFCITRTQKLTLLCKLKHRCQDCSCDFDGYPYPESESNLSHSSASVREVTIPLSWVGTHEFWELLLNFWNLEKLILFDMEDKFQNKVVDDYALQILCEPMWFRLSGSLETISIRSRKFNKKFKKNFPTVFICSRPQQ
ncbi:unnamed protein product [Orchesella dallaii]|uniref:F-box domain-containing protein n=1 Tax=Orchesella dallaii TaxID=48710 RepID=A0ABP1PZF8_9HEXA